MDHFEETVKRKADYRHHDYDQGYYRNHRDRRDSRHVGMDFMRGMLIRVVHNKALLVIAAVILVAVVIAAVAVVSALFPLASKFIGSIDQIGIKGALDTLLPMIKKLWGGTGGS
jgi:hypothetical protein